MTPQAHWTNKAGSTPIRCKIQSLNACPLFTHYYQTAKEIFKKIEAGEISATISTLVFAELLVPAYRSESKKYAEKIVHILSNYPNLKIIPLTTKISTTAARLRSIHGLRTPAAIHIATALESKSSGIITNDKGFKKVASADFGIWLFE